MNVFYHPFSIKIWSWLNDVKSSLLDQEYRILLPMQEMMGSIPGLGRSPGEGSSWTEEPGRLQSMHVCLFASAVSDALRPHGPWATRLLCPWDSPG